MAWIESHQELRDHPKTKRLCRLLGVNRREAVGLLHFLWWWAYDYASEGDLSQFTDEDIADAVDWEADAAQLTGALIAAGFLDEDRRIHDWEVFAEKWIDRRRANAERMRVARAARVERTSEPRAEHVQRTTIARATATGPDRTIPGPDLTGPGDFVSVGAPADAAPPPPQPTKAKRKPDPRASRLPDDWGLTEAHYEYAARRGFDRTRAEHEATKFVNHHRGKGSRMVDWLAVWGTWMDNAVEIDARRGPLHLVPQTGDPEADAAPLPPPDLQPLSAADRELWDRASTELQLATNKANYESFLADLRPVGRTKFGGMALAPPNPKLLTAVSRFLPAIRRALEGAGDLAAAKAAVITIPEEHRAEVADARA